MFRRVAAGMVVGMVLTQASGLAAAAAEAPPPPPTEKTPVTDTYHGVAVLDEYRWLENWDDAKVKAWSEAQNAHARAYLDALPDMPKIRERVREIMTAPSVRHSSLHAAGPRLLAMRRESGKQQPVLVAFEDLHGGGAPRVLLDPATMPEKGATIDWFVPSPDGKLVAVSVSLEGTESGDVRIISAATGERVEGAAEVVPGVNGGTAGGSLAWAPDSKGFYYTRYPREGDRPEEDRAFFTQVYFHALGTDSKDDRYEVGKDFPKIAEIDLDCDSRGTVLASVQNGDGGEFIHLLRDAKAGQWTRFTRYEDRVVQALLGPDSAVYMVSRKGAPRGQLLRLALASADQPESKPVLGEARVIVPEQADTLVSEFFEAGNLCVTDRHIYAVFQLGGPSEIRVFDHAGKVVAKPAQPPVAAAGGLADLGGGRVAMSIMSFVQPATWYVHAAGDDGAAAGALETLDALSTHSAVSFDGYTVVREMATSRDGTKVPVNIVHRKGLELTGDHPCVVTGYGGYGVNIEPYFNAADMALLEQGFVLATANIRGGGEFGESWHLAGNLVNKQNVFDDFAAACRHVIERGYTGSGRLAIEGGSNGGLLMGAIVTQHPSLASAVVSHVGIYDMLRVELSPNGAFNIPEFGTVKDEAQFNAMHAYSPYHNVQDGTAYPATLFLTGANDPRVDPMQSRKMTARLQAAVTAGAGGTGAAVGGPILLRTSGDTGHGAGTPLDERISQAADVNAFLMNQLGVRFQESGQAEAE